MNSNGTDKYVRSFFALSGIGCSKFSMRQMRFIGDDHFCMNCPEACNYGATHLYGCCESQIYDGKYEYYCPQGANFIAVSVDGDLFPEETGVIIGPYFIGEHRSSKLRGIIPSITQEKAESISMIAVRVFAPQRARHDAFDSQGSMIILNEVFKSVGKQIEGEHDYELIRSRLNEIVGSKDPELFRKYLAQHISSVFSELNGKNIEELRNRMLTVVVFLSQFAIDNGADTERVFLTDVEYFGNMNRLGTAEQVSACVDRAVDRITNYIFSFGKIKHTDIIYKIIAYIKDNYPSEISLDDLADHVYMSKSYVSKIFREEMNCSITDYINYVRIKKSKNLLADRSLSIDEIVAMTGFTDKSYFTKVFKKIVGISPGKYRLTNIKNV